MNNIYNAINELLKIKRFVGTDELQGTELCGIVKDMDV